MRLRRAELLALHRELVATPSVSGDEVAIVSLLSLLSSRPRRDGRARWRQPRGLGRKGSGKGRRGGRAAGGDEHACRHRAACAGLDAGAASGVERRGQGLRAGCERRQGFGGGDDRRVSRGCRRRSAVCPGVDAGARAKRRRASGRRRSSRSSRGAVSCRRWRWSASRPGSTSRWRRRGCSSSSWWRAARRRTRRTRGRWARATPSSRWRAISQRSRHFAFRRGVRSIRTSGARRSSRRSSRAASARNVVPAEARAVLDCRTVPAEPPEALLARLRAVVESELVVLSDRLVPVATDAASALVAAALRARPEARLYGSATLSDLTFFRGIPAVKVGPGRERALAPAGRVRPRAGDRRRGASSTNGC